MRLDSTRPEYVRALVRWDGENGGLAVETTGGQRSSRVGSMLMANALLLCMPALVSEELGGRSRGTVPKGDRVDALLMGQVILLSNVSNTSTPTPL